MDKIVEQSLLYDFYGELLTDKQRRIYELYYQDDWSLAEISEAVGISRQGVHDSVKKSDKQLKKFEGKLKLVEHFAEITHMADEMNALAKDIEHSAKSDVVKDKAERMTKLTEKLLEKL